MRTRLAGKQFFQPRLQRRPGRLVVLRRRVHVGKAQLVQQQRIELGFQRADGDEAAVGAAEHIVERRVVERARLGAVELPVGTRPVRDRAQHGHDVDDGRIHHATLPAGTCLDQRAGDAEDHAQGAARVADDSRRQDRAFAPVRRQRQQARQCHVVEVVAGGARQRAALAPTGHAAVDQARVARPALRRPQAQALHHAGAISFDHHVGCFDQRHGLRVVFRLLEVQRHDRLAEAQRTHLFAAQTPGHRALARRRHHGHLGAHVGQHAARQRPRSDALELDDPHTRQRRPHAPSLRAMRSFMISLVPP
ncbi:hypothetical protein D3C86_727130 [compost metagenome]